MNISSKFTPQASTRKVALVDFDGVIIRNKRVQDRVVKGINGYVSQALYINSPKVTERINSYLYSTYGHTMIGLDKVAGHDLAGSLQDFNKFVYDNIDISQEDFISIKPEVTQWKEFIAKLRLSNIPVYIFSNAPRNWCLNFIDQSDVAGFIMDNLPQDAAYLKPELKIFETLHSWFQNHEVYFIDDKIHNMKHTVQKDNWTNIVFDEHQPRESFKLQDRLYVTRTLDACADIIA